MVPAELDLTEADYEVLGRLRWQIRRFLHFSEEAARSEGLEPQQHQLMLAVRFLENREAEPTVGQIADHMFLRHHSVVGLVDRLERRRLVERLRGSSDRRQVRVRLTPEGIGKLRRLSAAHWGELREAGPKLVEALNEVVSRRLPGSASTDDD